MKNIVIGKRTSVGAAIMSTCAVLAHFWPEHAAAFISAAVPLTFGIQVWIANKLGVTVKNKSLPIAPMPKKKTGKK